MSLANNAVVPDMGPATTKPIKPFIAILPDTSLVGSRVNNRDSETTAVPPSSSSSVPPSLTNTVAPFSMRLATSSKNPANLPPAPPEMYIFSKACPPTPAEISAKVAAAVAVVVAASIAHVSACSSDIPDFRATA